MLKFDFEFMNRVQHSQLVVLLIWHWFVAFNIQKKLRLAL
jgi:hypothetical protein